MTLNTIHPSMQYINKTNDCRWMSIIVINLEINLVLRIIILLDIPDIM